MLELLIAFGAGAAASSWMHIKSRRKAREANAPPSSAPKSGKTWTTTPRSGSLTGAERAAVIFMSLPPETSAHLFSELTPEEVETITLEISKLPRIDALLRQQVLADFTQSLGISADRFEEAAQQEPRLIAVALRTLGKLTPTGTSV